MIGTFIVGSGESRTTSSTANTSSTTTTASVLDVGARRL
jgi:hypothetical protein